MMEISDFWILVDRKPVPSNSEEWMLWRRNNDKTVRITDLGEIVVVTVFIGLGVALFETRIVGGKIDGWVALDTTWEKAEAAHKMAVERVVAESGRN
jgi:hypothetical protein